MISHIFSNGFELKVERILKVLGVNDHIFRIFTDESGPAAMQHGNSASNLKPLQVFQVTGRLLKELNDRVLGSFQFIYKQPTSTSVKMSVNTEGEILRMIINTARPIFILLLVTATQFLLYPTFQTCCILTDFALKPNLICIQNHRKTDKSESKRVERWKKLRTCFISTHFGNISDKTNELLHIHNNICEESNPRWLKDSEK